MPAQIMSDAYAQDPGVRLMLAYQAGDEHAFDELVRSYTGQVFALLTRFLGPLPEREDLVQEVFLRVVRSRDRYQPQARFSTWLYRIVYNLSVNHTQRSAGRAPVTGAPNGDLGPEGEFEPTDPNWVEPSVQMERTDIVRAVRSAIAGLPESQRMALVLARYEELPYAEIGRILGTSEKAVKSLVHRARENLRQVLGPYVDQEALG